MSREKVPADYFWGTKKTGATIAAAVAEKCAGNAASLVDYFAAKPLASHCTENPNESETYADSRVDR